MITVEKLELLGCNTAEGLERCLNEESFYLELLPDAFDKKRYEELENSIKSGDLTKAFDEAHALKGILSNLAITPLLNVISEITEHLRGKEETDYGELLSRMWDIYGKFEAEL